MGKRSNSFPQCTYETETCQKSLHDVVLSLEMLQKAESLDSGLVNVLAEKRYAERTEQKPGFLVVGCRGADHNGNAWDHSGWVSV